MNPDIYLLDEPTNHLSESAVKWITDYLCNLTHQTVVTVSHDTTFLENTSTDVIHYEQRDVWGPYRKLVHYKGKMSAFVELQPQAKHYFELSSTDNLKFHFPNPGRLEGIRTSTQKFLEMEHVDFAYPGQQRQQLTDVTLKMTLSTRAVILGSNGAGKTTLIKMLVGETVPSNLGICKFYIHQNLRIAYVAQHAFYHVEQHMEEAPAAYIQWRFKHGYDREKMESEAFRITPEEQQAMDDFGIEGDLWSRRMRAGQLEYEVKKVNVPERNNKYYSRDDLMALGFEHLIKQTDEKIASKEAGLDLRPVTTSEIQKHLDGFGLPQEFGTYGKIRGLSGGQKVKLVLGKQLCCRKLHDCYCVALRHSETHPIALFFLLAAAFWTNPHMVVLDEPTNFLDREALGALSEGLNNWGGAVLMISHNKEFYSSICREEWHLEKGVLSVSGVSDEREMKAISRKKKYEKELEVDEVLEKAGGNMNSDGDKYKDATVNFWGQSVSKKEARQYEKAKKKRDVPAMRKILQIPSGKVMPGFEELGDGK
jgi:elongation factor 3